jgi:AcrR family transcriptional regulator
MADMSADPIDGTTRKQERRRGASLEEAILDAAWEQLTAEGYGHFTMDTVAARARTSKPVLYRRWKSSDELLRAAIRHRGAVTAIPDVDTGTLRGDYLALLRRANTLRSDMAALLSSVLGSYYDETGLSPADLRNEFLSERSSTTDRAIERAIGRGEIDPARLTPRIASLPFDLWRHELMMNLKPVPDHVLRQIVDDIFIPLVAPRLRFSRPSWSPRSSPKAGKISLQAAQQGSRDHGKLPAWQLISSRAGRKTGSPGSLARSRCPQ